jgi:uncharacterized protein
MQVRELGNTGIKAAILGFGAGRLPESSAGVIDFERAVPLLQRGIEMGINYIDTALVYHDGQSERAIGLAIQDFDRERLILTTKISVGNEEEARPESFRKRLETSLERLNTPYVDFLLLHGLSWDPFNEFASRPGMALQEARKAQSEGLIRHLGFSSHDTLENVLDLIRTGEFELLLLQYNYLDRQNEAAFELAARCGMGVTVMGPVGAGRLVEPGKVFLGKDGQHELSAPELALRFVWCNPNVHVALSGMNSFEQLEENVALAQNRGETGDPLNQSVLSYLADKQALADQYCSLCGKCLPCPNDVHVPENFRYMNWRQVWGLPDEAKKAYASLNNDKGVWLPWAGHVKGLKADACQECAECEPRCPQHIPIIQQLKETAAAFAD